MQYVNFVYLYMLVAICIMYVCVLVCATPSYRATPTHTFVDYLRGGCEINLVIAVDFTVRVPVVVSVRFCVFIV